MINFIPSFAPLYAVLQTLQHNTREPGYNDFRLSENGEWLCVLSMSSNDNSNRNILFIFQFIAGSYQQVQSIPLDIGGSSSATGISMSEDGSVVAVHAEAYDYPAADCGGVLIYNRVGSTYSLVQTVLHPTNVASNVRFGQFASLLRDGQTLVVFSRDSRTYHVFAHNGTEFVLNSTLTSGVGHTNPTMLQISPSGQFFIVCDSFWAMHIYKNSNVWQQQTTFSTGTSFLIFSETQLVRGVAGTNQRGGFAVMTFNGSSWALGTTYNGSVDGALLASSMASNLEFTKFYFAETMGNPARILEYTRSGNVFTYSKTLPRNDVNYVFGMSQFSPMFFDNSRKSLVVRETSTAPVYDATSTRWSIKVRNTL